MSLPLGTAIGTIFRFGVVLNEQSNGVEPDTEEIYPNVFSATMDFRNILYMGKYKILSDKVEAFSPFFSNVTSGQTAAMTTDVSIDINCGYIMEFTGGGGIASVSRNLAYFFASKEEELVTTTVTFSIEMRMRYYNL